MDIVKGQTKHFTLMDIAKGQLKPFADPLYEFTCEVCGTVARARRHEGVAHWTKIIGERDTITFKCPTCTEEVHMDYNNTIKTD